MELYRLVLFGLTDIFMLIYLALFIKRRFSWFKTIVCLGGMLVFLWGFEFLRYEESLIGSCYSKAVMGKVPVILMAFFLSEYRDTRGFFTALTGCMYGMFGNSVTKVLFSLRVPLIAGVAVEIMINVIVLILLCRFFRISYWKAQQIYRKEWIVFSLVLALFVAGNYLIFGALQGLPRNFIRNLVPIFYLLTTYTMIVEEFMVMDRLDEEQTRDQAVKILEASERILAQETEAVQMAEHRITHYNQENRQFIARAETLLEKGEYEKLEDLLSEMQELPMVLSVKRYCQNLPVSGVISYYVRYARKYWIGVTVNADVPEELGQYEWEIAVMIGNLLDNAVRACSKIEKKELRKITIKIQQVKQQLICEIRNTCDGTVRFDKNTGLPISDQGSGHGLGMNSVASSVEKIGGFMDCGVENGWFFVRILV